MSHPVPGKQISFQELILSLFTFHGRLNRSKFVIGHLFAGYVVGLAGLLTLGVPGVLLYSKFPDFYMAYSKGTIIVLAVIMEIALLSICVRRLQDINLSGWFAAPYTLSRIMVVFLWENWRSDFRVGGTESFSTTSVVFWGFIVSACMFFLLAAVRGSVGSNRYGNVPE